MYVVTNGLPKNNAQGSGNVSNKILVVNAEDVLVYPGTDAAGIRMVGNFVLKPGAAFEEVYSTKSKTEFPYEGDGDEDAISITHKAMLQHPGSSLVVKEFIQYWKSKSVFILHKKCGEDHYEVIGTPCAPLQLKPNRQDNNDALISMMNFEAFAKTSTLPKNYYGEIETLSPVAVADVEAIATTTSAFNYQLPNVADADTDVTFATVANTVGQGVTLIGGGGTNPATLSSGVNGPVTVLLNNDTPWVALKNSNIHFKVFVSGATKFLVEQSRG